MAERTRPSHFNSTWGFLQAILQGLTGMRFDYTFDNNKLQRLLKLDPIALPCLGEGVGLTVSSMTTILFRWQLTKHISIKNKGKTTQCTKLCDNFIGRKKCNARKVHH